jgi:hypothetical protein
MVWSMNVLKIWIRITSRIRAPTLVLGDFWH